MAKLGRRRLSGRTVEGLSVEKDTVYWDGALPGFGVRVYPTGGKVYIVQTRSQGRSARMSLGRHGIVSAEQARKRAALIIARAKSGEAALAPREGRKGVTVAELAERYLREHTEVRCKPITAKRVRWVLKKYVLPEFGGYAVHAVGRERVSALHEKLHGVPAMANQVADTLSAMFNVAETWEVIAEGSNPCVRLRRYPVRSRERFLTEAEFNRLGRVLSELEAEGEVSANAAAAIRLLMFTGCRRNEILRLRWEEVDLERGELRLRDSKTGPRTVPLSPPAAAVLSTRPRLPGDGWVIPGRTTYLVNVHRSWCKVRARADLEDVRLHDLRHSFASRALALGESLPMIGRLLGHAQVQTTARYAHLAEESVKASAERIADSIAEDILDLAEGAMSG